MTTTQVPERVQQYLRHAFTTLNPCSTNHDNIEFGDWTYNDRWSHWTAGQWCGRCPDCKNVIVVRSTLENV